MDEWPDKVKSIQSGWIGKIEGVKIFFQTINNKTIEIFTNTPQNLYTSQSMMINAFHDSVKNIIEVFPELKNAVLQILTVD